MVRTKGLYEEDEEFYIFYHFIFANFFKNVITLCFNRKDLLLFEKFLISKRNFIFHFFMQNCGKFLQKYYNI